MGVVASASGGEGKKFELATEMIQQGVLADVVDKGMVPNKFKPGTTQHKAYFTWILEEKDSDGRNKRVFESFTVSLHEKAGLRKRVSEFGYKFSKSPDGKTTLVTAPGATEATTGIDLDTLIGTKRTLVLSTEDGTDGEPYVKILATQKPQGKGLDIPADFTRKQDRKQD